MAFDELHSFHLPRALIGFGAIDALAGALAEEGIRRPLLVTDPGLVAIGAADRLATAMGSGCTPMRYAGVTENPLFADADRGLEAYRDGGCDAVVALGGGSVIDTAKFIALLVTNGGRVADYAGVPGAAFGKPAPLVAVPTTAGTGSESNGAAGIHPTADATAVGIFSHLTIPRLVVLDPALTVSLPPRLTAATGVDALSHCIEGFLSRHEPPLAGSLALDGVGRVMRWIRRAVADGTDKEARYEMLVAAYAGGGAISMGLGPAHAIAIVCGDQGFHHGMLSGIGLIATLDSAAHRQSKRAAELRRAMGLAPEQSLSRAVADLMTELQLPTTLGELGYRIDDLQALALEAHRNFFNETAYHHPSPDEYRLLIENVL